MGMDKGLWSGVKVHGIVTNDGPWSRGKVYGLRVPRVGAKMYGASKPTEHTNSS